MSDTLETLKNLVEEWMEDARYKIRKAKNSCNSQAVKGHQEYLGELQDTYIRLISVDLNNFVEFISIRRRDIEDQVKKLFPRVIEVLKEFKIYKYNDQAYSIVLDDDQDLGQPPMRAIRQIIGVIEMNAPDKPSILLKRV